MTREIGSRKRKIWLYPLYWRLRNCCKDFQWKGSVEAVADSRQNIKEEMADILIYLIQLADKLDVDLEEEVLLKVKKNGVKYPVSQ